MLFTDFYKFLKLKASKAITPLNVFVLLLVVLIIGLALRFVPFPSSINFSFYAAEINENNNIVSTGEIVIQGTRLNYLFEADKFQYETIIFPNQTFHNSGYDSLGNSYYLVFHQQPGKDHDVLSGSVCKFHSEDSSQYTVYSIIVDIGPDQAWCFATISDGETLLRFIGAADQSTDLQKLLQDISSQ